MSGSCWLLAGALGLSLPRSALLQSALYSLLYLGLQAAMGKKESKICSSTWLWA